MPSMSLTNFHFLQPLWLLAFIPLALIYWFIVHKKASGSDWNKVIDAHLLPTLLKINSTQTGKSFSALLMMAWVISVLALANPAWEKRMVPVFQTNMARVIVLDLSLSMNVADVKPSRLARAKFKIEDILAKNEEGQIGLVVFAGDAFTVTPLTRDADTISSMLSSLTPSIMPVQGSRADLGLLKAQELLQQAGVPNGGVLLMADGAEAYLAQEATEELSKNNYAVSVLSFGTQQGGPIPNVVGRDKKPIVVPMQEDVLKDIAKKGQGRYSVLSSSSRDIDYLLAPTVNMDVDKAERADDVNNQDWKSEGPLLVLLLLPLAALAFRRGWLLSVGIVVLTFGQPQPVMASVWDNLWTRQDQQADQALQRGDFDQAQQLADDPLRRGSAAFKKGEYEQALSDFSEAEGADAAYNKGNALAQLKQYEEAIKAYDDALKQQSNMQDAKDNKAKIEDLLKQQKEQEKKPQNQGNQDKQDQQNKEDTDDKNEQQKKQDSNSGEEGDEDKKNSEQKQQEGGPKDKKEEQKEEQSKENQFKKANEASEEKKKDDEKQEGKQAEEQNQQATKEKSEEEKQQAMTEKELKEKLAEDAEGKEAQAKIEADALSKEEKIAAEQWLRRIPDDPGELLKRKFKYQYKQRGQSSSGGRAPW